MSSTVSGTATQSASAAYRIEVAGAAIVRWSIVLLLLFFGTLKWTKAEADAIAPFVVNSPALHWLTVFGRQSASEFVGEFVGVLELAIAVLIALRRWRPRLAMIGGFLGTVMFLTTCVGLRSQICHTRKHAKPVVPCCYGARRNISGRRGDIGPRHGANRALCAPGRASWLRISDG